MHLPSHQELETLRKGLRKRKPPNVFDGMWVSEPGIGGIKLCADGDDFKIDWVVFKSGIKSPLRQVQWSALCHQPEFEMERLEIGIMVAAALEEQGKKVRDSIGHPVEALREAEPFIKAAEIWRHWALVKAGHMLPT